jgi:hypothetical protein
MDEYRPRPWDEVVYFRHRNASRGLLVASSTLPTSGADAKKALRDKNTRF